MVVKTSVFWCDGEIDAVVVAVIWEVSSACDHPSLTLELRKCCAVGFLCVSLTKGGTELTEEEPFRETPTCFHSCCQTPQKITWHLRDKTTSRCGNTPNKLSLPLSASTACSSGRLKSIRQMFWGKISWRLPFTPNGIRRLSPAFFCSSCRFNFRNVTNVARFYTVS